MDTNLGTRLAELSLQDAHENKMTYALESGRIYGLRQEIRPHFETADPQGLAKPASRTHVANVDL